MQLLFYHLFLVSAFPLASSRSLLFELFCFRTPPLYHTWDLSFTICLSSSDRPPCDPQSVRTFHFKPSAKLGRCATGLHDHSTTNFPSRLILNDSQSASSVLPLLLLRVEAQKTVGITTQRKPVINVKVNLSNLGKWPNSSGRNLPPSFHLRSAEASLDVRAGWSCSACEAPITSEPSYHPPTSSPSPEDLRSIPLKVILGALVGILSFFLILVVIIFYCSYMRRLKAQAAQTFIHGLPDLSLRSPSATNIANAYDFRQSHITSIYDDPSLLYDQPGMIYSVSEEDVIRPTRWDNNVYTDRHQMLPSRQPTVYCPPPCSA